MIFYVRGKMVEILLKLSLAVLKHFVGKMEQFRQL